MLPLTSVLSPVYDLLLCIQCVGRVSPGVSQWGGNLLNKLLIVSLFCFIISRVISYAVDVGHVCREKCTITILTANSTLCFGICQNKLNICLLNKEKMGGKKLPYYTFICGRDPDILIENHNNVHLKSANFNLISTSNYIHILTTYICQNLKYLF